MDKQNPEVDMVEGHDHGDEKSQGPFHEALGPMRAKSDDLSVWATMRLYKVAGIIAMAGAFSASLDGYQINLNGGIVSNKGFIKQMAGGGKKIIAGRYISAWGGIQSAGQTIGQLLIQYVTEAYGRKVSLLIILAMFITLFASVALYELKAADPTDYKTPIYTQWAMVGVAGIIFILLPESPWWLVSKGRFEKASKSLQVLNRGVEAFDVQEHINVMNATIQMENDLAAKNKEEDMWEVFRGRNLIRFIICSWPKVTQQFVGLAVFNTYATYFFQYAGNKNPFLVTVILSSVQLLSMILTSTLTDQLGRRPLTVYPYAVTVLSVLSLGIIGCFDYTDKTLSSLLIFFACLATFSTTGASSIGYAYAAEMPQQRLRARTSAWALAASNAISVMFSFTTPIMINGDNTHWGVKTAFFFAGTGTVAVAIAWLILPEVARRTPAEIDELFEKRVPLRKFKGYVTEVEMHANEVRQSTKISDMNI
ncbi:hypothetical protein ACHAQF_005277 [Verticillium nonalfalfae]